MKQNLENVLQLFFTCKSKRNKLFMGNIFADGGLKMI